MKKYNANQNMVKWMNGIDNMLKDENGQFIEKVLTKDESHAYLEGLKSISKPTGINLFDENEIIKSKNVNIDDIYNAIKESMLNLGIEESEIDSFMRSNEFTISFGETEVWESRNHNPKLVKKEAMTISYKSK